MVASYEFYPANRIFWAEILAFIVGANQISICSLQLSFLCRRFRRLFFAGQVLILFQIIEAKHFKNAHLALVLLLLTYHCLWRRSFRCLEAAGAGSNPATRGCKAIHFLGNPLDAQFLKRYAADFHSSAMFRMVIQSFPDFGSDFRSVTVLNRR